MGEEAEGEGRRTKGDPPSPGSGEASERGTNGKPASAGSGVASERAEATKNDIPDDAAVEGGANNWPDESAEAAFRAESRERGEPDLPVVVPVEATEETDNKNLPALEDLVKRISPEARELLDELFRAKFTGVKRVPAKALKS